MLSADELPEFDKDIEKPKTLFIKRDEINPVLQRQQFQRKIPVCAIKNRRTGLVGIKPFLQFL